MKKVLLTGGTGFIGRNILAPLKKRYDVYAPRRSELNLLDFDLVEALLRKNKYDVIIHTAIPNPTFNEKDSVENLFEDSLRVFMNFYKLQEYYGKMIYFGSGAEFDKSLDIKSIEEEGFGRSLPKNGYGLAKYIMNELCRKSNAIYNLRIFGCYGPTDADFKFITNMIHDCQNEDKLVVNQNCYFDYLYVEDIVQVLDAIISSKPQFHDYNVCSGKRYSLIEIADIVRKEMKSNLPININKDGLNLEYTGNNERLIQEFPFLKLSSIEDGIKKLIEFEEAR